MSLTLFSPRGADGCVTPLLCVHVHILVSSKNISLREDAYERLAAQKREGESFDDVIERLTARDKWAGFGIAGGDAASAREGMAGIHESMRGEMERDVDATE